MCSCPAGPALARIVNSVTDTDYSGSTCLEADLRLDADDSFRRGSTEVGWAIGAGFELPLAARWALRFDGSYLDFGSEAYRVKPVRQQFMRGPAALWRPAATPSGTGWASFAWGSSIGSAK